MSDTYRVLSLGGLLVLLCLGAWAAGADTAGDAPPQDPGAPQIAATEDEAYYDDQRAEISDGDAEARYQLAVRLYQRYDRRLMNAEALELAEEELRAVVALDPDHPQAQTMLDIVEAQLEDYEQRVRPDYFWMIFYLVGGLGVFLLGMKNMSEGMQAIAGNRLRRMIAAVTDNRLLATGVGVGVTCTVQSSSITTVIVVGMVNSGLMALHQALGVILGANIGTTITGWVLVLQIGRYGLPMLGVSAFVYIFARQDRWRYLAMFVMGLGMIFFGLELMKDGVGPLRDVPAFREMLLWFQADTYFGVLRCVLVGCLITFAVQSSSAALGILIGLTATGAIPFHTAAAVVLGENIGTTITAYLASLGATTNARRAAYGHILFNVIGVAWITAIFPLYVRLIDAAVAAAEGHHPMLVNLADFEVEARYAAIVTAGIAATHTGFNVVNTLIFLPFVRSFARFLEWLVPEKRVKEKGHLRRLDARLVESPIIGIEQSRGEVLKMAHGVGKMLEWTRQLMNQPQPDEPLVRKVFHREQIMDDVQQEVIHFLTDLLTGSVPHAVTEEGRQQLRCADEYESVSDYVSTVLKSHLRLHNAGLTVTEREQANLMELHDRVTEYVDMITAAVAEREADVLSRALSEGDAITRRFKQMRDQHMVRLTEEKVDPVLSMSYTAMLTAYRKIKDHALNIAEALAA